MARRPREPRFDPEVPSHAPPPGRRRGGFGRLLFNLLLLLVLIPLVLVLVYRFVGPPMTVLMVQRAGEDGVSKDWLPLNRIDRDLVHAVVAAEDSRFCQHRGFDVEAIRKAMEANENGGKVRGGSTISQQTAKNVFLWPQRSWVRKGLEAGFTVLIETVWGKPRIMEVYLNVIEFAPGVYGAEAAAQRWFGKSAENLTRTEAARLAAILPAPRRYKAASPGPYVRRRSGRIAAAIQVVRDEGLSACAFGAPRRRPDPVQEQPPARRERTRQLEDLLDAARNPDAPSEVPLGEPADPALPVEPEPGTELEPTLPDVLDGRVQPPPPEDPTLTDPAPTQEPPPAGTPPPEPAPESL